MLDSRDVDAQRIPAAPRGEGFVTKPAHEREGFPPVGERHQRETLRGPLGQDAQRDRGDHAQGAFRSDEEIDQIHARGGEVARRQFRQGRHAVARDVETNRAICEAQLEPSFRARARLTSLDVQHVSRWQDDGQGGDPVAVVPYLMSQLPRRWSPPFRRRRRP